VRTEPVSFFVPGLPISQGSKRHVGGGRMIESSRKLAPWRALVSQVAATAMEERLPFNEPLWMAASFSFWRPQAHYRSGEFSEQLKPSAPEAPMTYPDIEKLVRAINDAIEGIVFRNDSMIARLYSEKTYGAQLGAAIVIGPLDAPIPKRLLTASNGDIHHAASVLRMVEEVVR
jgi:Holliday junction resolvase RusA-like endonuclease